MWKLRRRRSMRMGHVLLLVVPALIEAQQTRSDTLAPVQITVLRTPFDLTKAPFSVTLVSPRDATRARPGFALDEVLGRLPGIQVDNRLNFALGERIAIRGLGARSQFGVRGVRVVVDDIPATLADGQTVLNNVDLGTLGHAQVLRGPASALYGNAAGGAILLESAPAPSATLQPNTRVMFGSYGLRRIQLGAGGTTRAFGYSLSGGRLDYKGFRAFSDARNAHGNGMVTYGTSRLELKAVINAEHHNARNPGSLSDSLLQIDRRQAFANNVAQQTGEKGSQTQTGLSSRIHLPYGELRVSAYASRRTLHNPIPPRIIALNRDAGGARAAYAITFGPSDWPVTTIIGLESSLQHDDRQNYLNNQGVRGNLVLDQRERVTNIAPFAQGSTRIGPFTLFGGLRYDRIRFAANDDLVNANNPDDSGIRIMSAASPSLGVSYLFSSGITVYANVSTAFQTPTTTELSNSPEEAGGFNPALQPERVRSGEIGLRGQLAGRVTYQSTFYHMRIRDALIPFELASFPGRQFYRNAGSARHHGLESDIGVTLSRLISARASYSYTNARFVIDTSDAVSNAGFRIPSVIPHVFTMALDAESSSGHLLSFEIRAQSSTPANDGNTAFSAGYVTAGIRGNIPVGAGTSLFGGVGNILNTRYNTSVSANAVARRYFEPAAGRTVYMGIHWAP